MGVFYSSGIGQGLSHGNHWTVRSAYIFLEQREGKADQSSTTNPVFFQQPPPIEWHLTKNKEEFHILTVSVTTIHHVTVDNVYINLCIFVYQLHPVEFARQLTLILSELFRYVMKYTKYGNYME